MRAHPLPSFLLLLITLLGLSLAEAADSPIDGFKGGRGFGKPEFYPNSKQLKSMLRGKSARPGANETFLLEDVSVETWMEKGEPNFSLISKEATWDNNKLRQIASSTNRLEVTQGSNAFRIKGVGWTWYHTNQLLIISNQVETVVDKSRLPRKASTTPQSLAERTEGSEDLKISSDQLTFDYQQGVVMYSGNVLAEDSMKSMRCRKLVVTFSEKGSPNSEVENLTAEGDIVIEMKQGESIGKAYAALAQFSPASEDQVVELSGVPGPRFEFPQYKGSADRLVLLLAKEEYQARGHSKFQVARPSPRVTGAKVPDLSPSDATLTRWTEIRSESSDVRMGEKPEAKFWGNVHFEDPDYNLTSQRLSVQFEEADHAVRAINAEGDVKMMRRPQSGKVDLDSKPPLSFRAEKVVVEMDASGSVMEKMIATKEVAFRQGDYEAFGDSAFFTSKGGVESVELSGSPSWKGLAAEGRGDVLEFRTNFFKATGHAVFKKLATPDRPAVVGKSPKESSPEAASLFGGGPVEVTADSYEYQMEEGWARFRNRVRVESEGMTLQSGKLDVRLLDTVANELAEIIAEQDVVIEKEGQVAKGQKAVYDAEGKSLRLTGRPTLKSAELNVTEAQLILWNLATGKMTLTASRIELDVDSEKARTVNRDPKAKQP